MTPHKGEQPVRDNQASPAQAAFPAPQPAAAYPHNPAGDHAVGRRPAHLPLAAVPKKTARYAPVLLGGVAAAVLTMAVPAMASPITGHDATSTRSISTILNPGDIVTGVRGTGNGKNVILTGAQTPAGSNLAMPFLYQGPLTPAAKDTTVLHPPFPGGIKTATFYGPDTPYYNPETIPAGQVRAVGSYQTMTTPPGVNSGVMNHGMIYLGPVSGSGGQWTSIDVPADGSNTVGHVRACPITRPNCFVRNTIAHSTMGDLVVGNYDLNPGVPGGLISANAFIYNMSTHLWTLLRLGGSMSSLTTLYGIWQNGGSGSPNYTLAGGSSAHGSSLGTQRAFLMNYNERTGVFGSPTFYSYGNAPAAVTHFDGITKVQGGFNLVAVSSAQPSSMAFVPTTGGNWPSFGTATWHPIDVAASRVCSGGCTQVTGNTVYQNQVMGLYVVNGTKNTYLATVHTP
jgi:hypothetical protein